MPVTGKWTIEELRSINTVIRSTYSSVNSKVPILEAPGLKATGYGSKGDQAAGRSVPKTAEIHEIAAGEYRNRRQRDQIFVAFPHLFGEPAWDIMLFLMAEGARNNLVSITSACYASGAPLTTALRKIAKLERFGLAARFADPFDGRRQYLRLTQKGEALARDYLIRC